MLFWQNFVDMDAQGTWPKGWPLTFDILFISITAFANFWKRPSHQHRKKIFCILPIDICKQIYSYWQYFLYLFSSGIHSSYSFNQNIDGLMVAFNYRKGLINSWKTSFDGINKTPSLRNFLELTFSQRIFLKIFSPKVFELFE